MTDRHRGVTGRRQGPLSGPAFLDRLEDACRDSEPLWGIEVLSGSVVACDEGAPRLATYGARRLWGRLANDANPYDLAKGGSVIDMGDERALHGTFRDGDWLVCPTDADIDRAFARANAMRLRACLGDADTLRADLAQGVLEARIVDAGGGRVGIVVELAHQGPDDVSQVLAEVAVDDDASAHPGPSASVFVEAGGEVRTIGVPTAGDLRRNGNAS